MKPARAPWVLTKPFAAGSILQLPQMRRTPRLIAATESLDKMALVSFFGARVRNKDPWICITVSWWCGSDERVLFLYEWTKDRRNSSPKLSQLYMRDKAFSTISIKEECKTPDHPIILLYDSGEVGEWSQLFYVTVHVIRRMWVKLLTRGWVIGWRKPSHEKVEHLQLPG